MSIIPLKLIDYFNVEQEKECKKFYLFNDFVVSLLKYRIVASLWIPTPTAEQFRLSDKYK